MYQQLHSLPLEKQVEMLTKHLVSFNSINGTTGEVRIIDELYHILKSFPYFQEHPEHVWVQHAPNDPIGRKNVFAFLEGQTDSPSTILYHSHLDTVGIEDFGLLKEHAFSSDRLEAFFQTYEGNADVQSDAKSGDWLFGRGSVDMKSGAAVHLANILYFSQHTDSLEGNLLLLFNGDEEGEHRGITSALTELERLQQEKQLQYRLAINNDFITPLYDGDNGRYIYTGTAGKLLPCFYIYGREVHVGDTLSGIDPNFIAAQITNRLHNNYKLTESIPDELVLPPTCLYQRDNKDSYTVQTATSSRLYFNYFIYESTPKEVLMQLLEETKQVCKEAEEYLKEQFERYLLVTGVPSSDISWKINVTSYEDYVGELEELGIDTESTIQNVLKESNTSDLRELYFEMVGALQQLDPEKKARVIVFFAPPFLPHNYLKQTNKENRQLQSSIQAILENMQDETGEQFILKKFFPYLADGSFLSIHETDDELKPLLQNFPKWERLYPLPYETIRKLSIPSINMGVYGKDGHKWTERVYKPYSFNILPFLIRKTTIQILNDYKENSSLQTVHYS
ncbi:M20/M25/M40 family metallo-hydrolase [Bacillus gaemokensis]|uniref:Peptidase M20 n=1 Tax=Bacillus gaemokensis TaxID=574375 RepID=A0A073K4Y8_9BACI|nr:M20/M25/M40 family metallo-hydrolase [Bacillus gaemokensis]KEK21611.1 peptidase M20 [Bacillus gaemokensis]KYG30822.1 peptidase M20 [Bacillus gaemokensis]